MRFGERKRTRHVPGGVSSGFACVDPKRPSWNGGQRNERGGMGGRDPIRAPRMKPARQECRHDRGEEEQDENPKPFHGWRFWTSVAQKSGPDGETMLELDPEVAGGRYNLLEFSTEGVGGAMVVDSGISGFGLHPITPGALRE